MVERRSPKPKVGGSSPSAPANLKYFGIKLIIMVKVVEFIDQVIKETKKITWSNRKETMMSMMLVLVMVVIASLFFLGVDVVIYKLVSLVLNLGVN